MNIFQQELQQKYDGLQVQSRYYVLDIAECAEGFAECGEFDKAHELAQQALQAARKRENEGSPMQFIGEDDYAECSVAIVHALSGQLDEALPRFFRVMNHAESRQITELHIKSLRWIGVCYVRISMCTTALEYLTKSRSYAEQHHDTRQESLACGAIGDAHFGLGDAQTALQYYREALRLLDISQQLTAEDTVRLKSSILFSLASAHKELGGVRQATVYFEQALAAYKFQGNVNGICLSLLGVADMYAGQERFDKALELLFAAFEVAEHHAGVIEQAQVNFAIGEVYRRAGRAEKALEYLRAAESLLDSSQRVSIVGKVHEALSATYKTLGDIPRAFHHLEIFHDIREQTALQDGKRSVKYLQQGFEMERAQK
jgi:tetratricopeptide (TPR) repeat protein